MGLLSDQDRLAIHRLAPLWQPLRRRWWRNPLGYQLELISQPGSRPMAGEVTAMACDLQPTTCEIQGCDYALYRPGETIAFDHCTAHREATALVVRDALAGYAEQSVVGAGC